MAGSSLLCGFSLTGEQGLPSGCTSFSLQWLLLFQSTGPGHTDSVVGVVAPGLNCPVARGIAPGQGIRPTSPALPSGLFTTEPPGKSRLTGLKETEEGIADLNEIIVKAEEWSWGGKRWSEKSKTWRSVRVGVVWVMSKSWQRTKVPGASRWQRALVSGRRGSGGLGCWVDLPPGRCLPGMRESRT